MQPYILNNIYLLPIFPPIEGKLPINGNRIGPGGNVPDSSLCLMSTYSTRTMTIRAKGDMIVFKFAIIMLLYNVLCAPTAYLSMFVDYVPMMSE